MLRRTLALTCIAGAMSTGASPVVRDPAACAGACDHPIGYRVDPQFNADERAIIGDAMAVWHEGTGGRVCFTPGGTDLTIEKLDRSEQLRPWDTDWPRHVALTKGDHIWIVASLVDDPGEYRALVVHELGHHLGIGHIEDTPATYMHSTINDTPADLWQHARLPDRDAMAFCDVHRCSCAL